RHQQRRRRLAAAGRADPGGAAGGRARGQLQPGWWFQGHVGTRGGAGPSRPAARRPATRRGGATRRSATGHRYPGDGRPTVMLSRIAESLFWIGRYVERADDTARILDAFLARVLEDPWSDEDAACRSLLAILGVSATGENRMTAGDALERLAFDADDPSAIAGAVEAARENARGARETISSEMWECLNVTWHTLPARRISAEHLGPALFLGFVRERAAVLTGLAESTMSRDEGWRFLVLGRNLERVDMTARLLTIQAHAVEYAPAEVALYKQQWRTVLRA